jgi:predicted nucleic acid-binding protein
VSAYVLDASVAAKWFLPAQETLLQESLQLLADFTTGQVRFSVPDLFWPEIGHLFGKAVCVGRMSQESAEEAINKLLELEIPTLPSKPILQDAFAVATAFQRTVYDAIYVALAVVSGKMLVTADERLANALAAHLPVRWLGSLP